MEQETAKFMNGKSLVDDWVLQHRATGEVDTFDKNRSWRFIYEDRTA